MLEDKADVDQCNAVIDSLGKGMGCNGRKCRRNFENVNSIAFMAKTVEQVESKRDQLSQCCKSVEVFPFPPHQDLLFPIDNLNF